MLNVHRIINPPKSSNCFVVSVKGYDNCLIIDPGTLDCKELLAFLEDKKLKPEYVLLTHEHIDHIAGYSMLNDKYDCGIIGTMDCEKYVGNPRYNLTQFQDDYPLTDRFSSFKISFKGKLRFSWQGYTVECTEAKGHSLGTMLIRIGNHFFTGDTIVKGVKTTTLLRGGDKHALLVTFSIMQGLLSEEMIIHGGHLEDFTFQEAQKHIEEQIAYMQERIIRKKNDRR